jgi:hypothetical protein
MSKPNEEAPQYTCCASWESAANRGGCNFCTGERARRVWVVRSRDELRHTEIRLCHHCMTELRNQTRDRS